MYGGDDTPTLTRVEFSVLIDFIDSITSTHLVLDSHADAAKRIRHGMGKYKPEQLTSPPRMWLDAPRGNEIYATFNDVVNLFLHRNRFLISANVTEEQRAKHVKIVEDITEKLMVSFCTVFALRPDDYGSSVRASVLRALQGSDAVQATPAMEAAIAAMDAVDGMRQPRPAYRAYRTNAAMLVANHGCKVTQWADVSASGSGAPAGSSMDVKRLYKAAQMSTFPLRNIIDFLLPVETSSVGDELEVISEKQLSGIRAMNSLPRIGRTGLLRMGKEYNAMGLLLKQIQQVGEDLREIGNTALDSARVLQRLQKRQSGWIVAVAMTPDGRRIVFASDTGALYEHTFLFDSSGKHMHMYSEQEEKGRIPIALNCWRDQKAGDREGGRSRSAMFETEPQRIVHKIKQRGKEASEQRNLAITAIALTRNGRYVACCDRSGWLHVLHQRLDERRTEHGGRNAADLHGRWTHVGEPQVRDLNYHYISCESFSPFDLLPLTSPWSRDLPRWTNRSCTAPTAQARFRWSSRRCRR